MHATKLNIKNYRASPFCRHFMDSNEKNPEKIRFSHIYQQKLLPFQIEGVDIF